MEQTEKYEIEYKIFNKEHSEKFFYNHYDIMMGLSSR